MREGDGIVLAKRSFRVIIFSSESPRTVAHLFSRIQNEVPEAGVCGILYALHPPNTFQPGLSFVRNLPPAVAYVRRFLLKLMAQIGTLLLRIIHACPANPNGLTQFGLPDLTRVCQTHGGSLFVTPELSSPAALEFVRQLQPDLGIVYGPWIPKPELFDLPRQGSITIRKVAGCAGGLGSPDGQRSIGVLAHRVAAELAAGAIIQTATIAIETFDNLTSLALKTSVVGNDLLVDSVAEFARRTVRENPQEGFGTAFPRTTPQALPPGEAIFKPLRSRPTWKLLLRSVLFFSYAVLRNWSRRLRGRFPVIILYHHLVTQRPHAMGMSIECFLKQVEFLRRHYKIVSLSDAVNMLETDSVRIPTVVLTFDDGYQDNFINLRAVTELTSIPAALFVATQQVTLQQEFRHDLDRGRPGFFPLTWQHIVRLRQNGFEFGSHTRTHFDCGSVDLTALQREIEGSKMDLEQRLGCAVRFFAFPWGQPENMSPVAMEIAREKYPYVLSACGGSNFPSPGAKLWHLKRCGHPSDLWELELMLQEVLEF